MKFPKTEKAIRKKISKNETSLKKDKIEFGYVDDGIGDRYILFCLYFLLNDFEKFEKYEKWYKTEFSDDIGEPIQLLCWAFILSKRADKLSEARYKLAESMLSNLYFIPKLLGRDVKEYKMWHSSNYEDIDYFEDLPQQIYDAISDDNIKWISQEYDTFIFKRIRNRHIEIHSILENTREISIRRKLVKEADSLLEILE